MEPTSKTREQAGDTENIETNGGKREREAEDLAAKSTAPRTTAQETSDKAQAAETGRERATTKRNRAETIVYPVGDGLYVNLTNRCSCACTFCIRQKAVGVGVNERGDYNELWLDHEPNFDETMAAFDAYDMSHVTEVVFCGYGEPTYRFDLLKRVAREVKRRWGLPVRVNTNGQGSLINDRDIAPEFAGVIDAVSISLNAPDAETYQRIVRSKFGEKGFEAMLDFAKEIRAYVPNVTLTTVSTTISHADEERCRQLCEQLGVRYRIRAFA